MVEARLLALADSGSEGASPAAADHELRDGEILRCPAPMPAGTGSYLAYYRVRRQV